jgi:hypothetical protein
MGMILNPNHSIFQLRFLPYTFIPIGLIMYELVQAYYNWDDPKNHDISRVAHLTSIVFGTVCAVYWKGRVL